MRTVVDQRDAEQAHLEGVAWRDDRGPRHPRGGASPPALDPQDAVARLLGVPLLGIVIPQVTGSFGSLTPADALYWVGFFAFIGLSGLLWQGNRWLLIQVRRRLDWLQAPIQKLLVLVAANVAFTAPVTIAAMRLWFEAAGLPTPNWGIIKVVTLVCVLSVIIVSISYETVFLLQQRVSHAFTVEQLERAKLEAQLEALKNQVDPHFVLNALNALAHLIERDRDRALEFTETLADLYRYVLDNRDRPLVPLGEELAFARHYHALARLRFGSALDLDIDSDVLSAASRMRIPPISLQVLLENAVKHNQVGERAPLVVRVQVEGQTVAVSNPRRPAVSPRHSSKVGLQNLDARCRLLTGRGIEVEEAGDRFVVRVPIVAA